MDITLEKIKLVLMHEDVEGLIELGAPDDEYDSEALAILTALQSMPASQLSQSSLAAIIAMVWAESFGRTADEISLRMPAFMSIADRVLGNS